MAVASVVNSIAIPTPDKGGAIGVPSQAHDQDPGSQVDPARAREAVVVDGGVENIAHKLIPLSSQSYKISPMISSVVLLGVLAHFSSWNAPSSERWTVPLGAGASVA